MDLALLEIYKKRLVAVIAAYKKYKPNFDKKIQNEFIGQGFLNQTFNGIAQDSSVNIIAENETQYQIENPLNITETLWLDKSLVEKSPASLEECIAKAKDIAVFGFALPADRKVENMMFNDTTAKIPAHLVLSFVNIPKDAVVYFNNFIAQVYLMVGESYQNNDGKATTGKDSPLDKNSTFKIAIDFASQPQIEKFEGEIYYFSFTTIASKNDKLLLLVCNEGKASDENTQFVCKDIVATADKLKKNLNIEIKYSDNKTTSQDMSEEQQALVLGAVDALPTKFQSMIKGIDIELNTQAVNNYTKGAAGHYIRKQHTNKNGEMVEQRTVQLSDVAFAESAQRYGVSKKPSFYIFHELGHVVDAYPNEEYRNKYAQKVKQEAQRQKALSDNDIQMANDLYAAIEDANDKLDAIAAKYKSSSKKNEQYLFSNTEVFKTALKKDKEKNKQTSPQNITLYADVSDEEAFCESFALYMIDKNNFKLLSPNVFSFIDKINTKL